MHLTHSREVMGVARSVLGTILYICGLLKQNCRQGKPRRRLRAAPTSWPPTLAALPWRTPASPRRRWTACASGHRRNGQHGGTPRRPGSAQHGGGERIGNINGLSAPAQCPIVARARSMARGGRALPMKGQTVVSTQAQLEERLTAVETTLSEIQRRLATLPPSPNWLDEIIGSFKDEPAFDEVIAFGRAFRRGELPPEDAGAPQ